MAIINIQIQVNAAALVQQVKDGSLPAGTFSNPTNLGSYNTSNVYISMTTQDNNVNNNTQGQSELRVKADSGDTLSWGINTFDNNADNTVYLYNGTFNPGSAITPLVYISAQVVNYLPPSGNPTAAPTPYQNQVAFAQGTVIQVKNIQYSLAFIVVDNASGNIVGYFSWDPFIDVYN